MDVCDPVAVAVFTLALLKRAYRRKYWQLSAAIADNFFHIWQVNGATCRCCRSFCETALAGLNVSISDAATLPPRALSTAAAFDDRAAEDMIDVALLLPLHACMHKAAPALSPR